MIKIKEREKPEKREEKNPRKDASWKESKNGRGKTWRICKQERQHGGVRQPKKRDRTR